MCCYGIIKVDVDEFLVMLFLGKIIGVYWDGIILMLIVVCLLEEEWVDICNIEGMKIWSLVLSEYILL